MNFFKHYFILITIIIGANLTVPVVSDVRVLQGMD